MSFLELLISNRISRFSAYYSITRTMHEFCKLISYKTTQSLLTPCTGSHVCRWLLALTHLNTLRKWSFSKSLISNWISRFSAFDDDVTDKHLLSRTKRKTERLTAYACENSRLNISCDGAGQYLDIIRANYGRFSIAICNTHGNTDWSVNCMSPRTLRVIRARWNIF